MSALASRALEARENAKKRKEEEETRRHMELERRNPQLYQVDQDEDEFFDNPPESSDTIKEIVRTPNKTVVIETGDAQVVLSGAEKVTIRNVDDHDNTPHKMMGKKPTLVINHIPKRGSDWNDGMKLQLLEWFITFFEFPLLKQVSRGDSTMYNKKEKFFDDLKVRMQIVLPYGEKKPLGEVTNNTTSLYEKLTKPKMGLKIDNNSKKLLEYIDDEYERVYGDKLPDDPKKIRHNIMKIKDGLLEDLYLRVGGQEAVEDWKENVKLRT